MNTFIKSFILVLAILVYLFFAMYGLLILAFNGVTSLYIYLYLVFVIVTLCEGMYVLDHVLHHKKWNRSGQKVYIAICMCLLLIGGVPYAYERWENRFAVVSSEVDLTLYEPFKSDLLAQLEEPVLFQMRDSLLKLDGATALYPIYASFTQAVYPKKEYPLYTSEVQCNQTDGAYENLILGTTDLIFVASPSKQQQQMALDQQKELHMEPIGKEAFVFFVNASNPVDSLTIDQIRDIYSGKITNWKEVGGHDEAIEAFQRPENSGSQTALQKIMGDLPLMEPIEEDVKTGMGGILSEVADYKNHNQAIGYSFRFYATEMVNNKEIKLLKINDIYPNEQTIRDDTYPFTSPFYAIYTKDDENIQAFITWVISTQGQELIEKSGYVPYYL